MAESKTCPGCRAVLPLSEFVRNRTTKSGFGSYCKPCHNAKHREFLARQGGTRRYHLRGRYGVEPAEFDALVEKQGGLCAICRERTPTHLDHDHVTKTVRGALCVSCNNGLGLFRDKPERLITAATYLLGATE